MNIPKFGAAYNFYYNQTARDAAAQALTNAGITSVQSGDIGADQYLFTGQHAEDMKLIGPTVNSALQTGHFEITA